MSFLKLNVHSERRAAGTRDLIQAEEPAPPQTVTAMNMFSKAHWLLACGHLNSSSRKPSTAVVGAAPICINRLRRHLTCEGLREEANVAAGPLPRGCFQRLVALQHWHLGRVGHPSRANHLLPQQSSAEGYVGAFIAAAPAAASGTRSQRRSARRGSTCSSGRQRSLTSCRSSRSR